MSFSTYLLSLFSSAFISATLLPGGSEALLAWGVTEFRNSLWLQIGTATLGNVLGSLVTYAMGRWIPNKKTDAKSIRYLQKWGAPSLLFAWLPVVGDGLCLGAGWLRISFWQAAAYILIGKFVRYLFIAAAVRSVF